MVNNYNSLTHRKLDADKNFLSQPTELRPEPLMTVTQRQETTASDPEDLSISHDDANVNEQTTIPKPKRTPLPKISLLILFLIQFSEAITATVIYPFINKFVRDTGVTGGDERKTGYFAGVIVSQVLLHRPRHQRIDSC
jgi:hypothetical protein